MINNRRHDLDALRGIMMILGIVLHGAASFMISEVDEFWPYKFQDKSLFFDVLLGVIHLFRIPVFYVIAGFFMSYQIEKSGLINTIRKRIKRILFPFLFGLIILAPLIIFGFYVLIENVYNISFDTLSSFKNIYQINTVHFWFLFYLIGFYIIHIAIIFVHKLFKISMKASLINFYFLMILTQLIVLFVFGNECINGYYSLFPPIGSVMYFLSFYLLGIQVYNNIDVFDKIIENQKWWIIGSIVFTAFYLVSRSQTNLLEKGGSWIIMEGVLSVLAVNVLMPLIFGSFRKWFKKGNKIISYIAQSSYTIYIVHLPILVWLIYFYKATFTNSFSFYTFLVVATFCISFIIYEIIGRLKHLLFH